MEARKPVHWEYAGLLRSAVALLVLCLAFSSRIGHGETVRRTEVIDGFTYTVDYTLQPDGKVTVRATHIWTTQGWLVTAGTPPFDRKTAKTAGKPVQIGDKYYSIWFSNQGTQTAGEAYAVHENGQWKYLEPAAASAASASPASASKVQHREPLAEFRMYDRMVRQFGIQAHQDEKISLPSLGVDLDAKINVSIQPTLQPSSNTLAVRAQIGVDGTAVGSESRPGPILGRITGATVNSHITAQLSKLVHGTTSGVTSEPIQGTPETRSTITPFSQVRARFLRGIALGQAMSEAQAKSQQVKKPLEDLLLSDLDTSVNRGVDRVNSTIRQNVDKFGFGGAAKNLPSNVQFSTVGAGEGTYISARVSGPASERALGERPNLKDAGTTALSLFLHEDAVNHAIKPQLAEKERLRKALDKICNHTYTQKLRLCKKEFSKKMDDVSIDFDKTEPFKISFRDNQIKIEINATHEKASLKSGIAKDYQVSPYHVEIVYDVKPGGLVRKSVTATPQNGSGSAPADKTDQNSVHGDKPTLAGLTGAFNYLVRTVGSTTEHQEIVSNYSDAFEEKVDFPVVQIPAKSFVYNPKQDSAVPTVTGYMNVGPLDAQSANGWLGVSSKIQSLLIK